MAWSEVKHNSKKTTRQACADLLTDAMPGNSVTVDELTEALKPVADGGSNGYKENPVGGGPNPVHPVCRVFAYTDTAKKKITITLAFCKTIKRTGKSTIKNNKSRPRRRWWTINLGCQEKAGGPSIYGKVKEMCLEFYKNEMSDIGGKKQHFYIFDDADRIPEPETYKADEVLDELSKDPDAKLKLKKKTKEKPYAAYANISGLRYLSRLEIVYSL